MSTHLLVTGGAGFIGSHLADRWLADGGRVTVLDDLSTGTLDNLAAAARSADLRVVEGSVLDAPLVRRLAADCDHVAHLASVVGVERVCADPARTLRVGTAGADVVLRAAVGRARRVLVASSSEVYGTAPPAPCPETAPLVIGPPDTP